MKKWILFWVALGVFAMPSFASASLAFRFGPRIFPSGPGYYNGGTTVPGHQFEAITCPQGTTLCVAGDDQGDLLASSDPVGGARWFLTKLPGNPTIDNISCPSASLCIAADSKGEIVTSTNPTAGWQDVIKSTPPLTNPVVSCPSVTLCVVADQSGNVLTSTNPTGGARTWTGGPAGLGDVTALSCPSVSLCFAFVLDYGVAVSTQPAGTRSAWTFVSPVPAAFVGREVLSASCPSISLCAATDDTGGQITSTDPGAANAVWSSNGSGLAYSVHAHATGDPLNSSTLTCVSASFCIAAGRAGYPQGDGSLNSATIVTSTNPTGGARAWRAAVVTTHTYTDSVDSFHYDLRAVSCASATRCVAIDQGGFTYIGTPAASLPNCVVPNLNHKTLLAARKALALAHCRLGAITKRKRRGQAGRVLSQKPKTGSRLPYNSFVSVVVGRK